MSINVNLKYKNMTVVDGYFVTFDHGLDMIYKVTSDGSHAFSYPLDNVLGNYVHSVEWDGVNLWTLQDAGTDSIVIKRWLIEDYVCKLKDEFTYLADTTNKYSSQAFTVEHYHTTLVSGVSAGSTTLYVPDGYENYITTGNTVTIGPNAYGKSETINVFNTASGIIELDSPVSYDYQIGNDVQFYTNLWVFNDYSGTAANVGALYKFNAYSGSYITKYQDAVYKSVKAATFYKTDVFSSYGPVESLVFAKASNLLYIDVNSPQLDYFGTMIMDNVVGNTLSPVEDMAIYDKNIYRLEVINNGNNCELSVLVPMVYSIAVQVSPGLLPANGNSTAYVNTSVKDQFFQPLPGKLVSFSLGGSIGDKGQIIGPNPATTNSDGVATTIYKSGNEAGQVSVVASVDQ